MKCTNQTLILVLVLLWGSSLSVAYGQEEGYYEELLTFSGILNHIQSDYAYEVDPAQLVEAAITGIIEGLDPHTVYLNPEKVAQFARLQSGQLAQVGIEFSLIGDHYLVTSIRDESPASESRVQKGDALLKVDDIPVTGLAEPELQLLLNGTPGSSVRLGLHPPQDSTLYNVTLTRTVLPLHSVTESHEAAPGIGYVKIVDFTTDTPAQFDEAFKLLKKDKAKALIIDLRDNPGGALIGAVQLVDRFLEEGLPIIETRGRKNVMNERHESTRKRRVIETPLIVLINEGSASAAEIVAGSLQDHDRAVILGTNSFGKGLVQTPFYLNNGGLLMMTIGRYFTPSGRLIQRDYSSMSLEEYYNVSMQIGVQDTSNVYHTFNGRKVFGGGGIRPDVIVQQNLNSEGPYVDTQLEKAIALFPKVDAILKGEMVP